MLQSLDGGRGRAGPCTTAVAGPAFEPAEPAERRFVLEYHARGAHRDDAPARRGCMARRGPSAAALPAQPHSGPAPGAPWRRRNRDPAPAPAVSRRPRTVRRGPEAERAGCPAGLRGRGCMPPERASSSSAPTRWPPMASRARPATWAYGSSRARRTALVCSSRSPASAHPCKRWGRLWRHSKAATLQLWGTGNGPLSLASH